jgi:16S rRNA (guanine527-N7)-methyltransferase
VVGFRAEPGSDDAGAPPADVGPASFGPPVGLSNLAAALFSERLPAAVDYARWLATDGVVRGLIGPRETDRLWDRHLLNCAVVAELIPPGSSVTDVGAGAGLPGIVLALARPDLTVVLVEPSARRTAFLSEVVAALNLSRVSVLRSRAEEVVATLCPADVVTARALAPLDRLVGWCLPLVRVGGSLLAIKGASAAAEVEQHRATVLRLGGGTPVIRSCGAAVLDVATTVIEVRRERGIPPTPGTGRSGASLGSRAGSRSGGNSRSASVGRPPVR